jgi:protein TonB
MAIAAASRPPAGPEHYVWGFPGSPLKVHLELDLVKRLRDQIQSKSRGPAENGLLFGRAVPGITEIFDFQPAENNVAEAAAAVTDQRGQRMLVGYYRIETGPTLRLSEDDIRLAATAFPKRYQVFLLIQPNGSGSNATFFFHKDDDRMSEFAFLDFPFDARLLATYEHERVERDRIAKAQQEAVEKPAPIQILPAPAPENHRAPAKRFIKIALWILLIAFAAGVSIAYMSIRGRVSRIWSAIESRLPAAEAPLQTVTVASSAASGEHLMGLHAKRQNGDVELTWNRESPLIAGATSGMISIEDGTSTRQIPLTPARLRAGSVLYAPSSDQILMELAVNRPSGPLTESVLVVLSKSDGTRTYPLQISRPAPAGLAGSPGIPNNPPVAKAAKPFSVPTTSPAKPSDLASLPEEPLARTNPETAATIPPIGLLQPPASAPRVPTVSLPAPVQPEAAAPRADQAITISPYQPPEPINRITPRFPAVLRPLVFKPLAVEIRVTIDMNGRVTKAEPVSPKGIHKFFLDEAVAAARFWTFKPARRGDLPIASESILKFVFSQ